MGNNPITSKDIIGWIISVAISLVPLLLFYLRYRIDKKQSNKKISNLEEMLYKQEITLQKEIIARKEEIIIQQKETITHKDLEINELKKELQELKKIKK